MQILPLNTLSATLCNKLEIKMTAHVGWIYKRSGSNKQTKKEEVRRLHQIAGRSRIHITPTLTAGGVHRLFSK